MLRSTAALAFIVLAAAVLWSGCAGGAPPNTGPSLNVTSPPPPNASQNISAPLEACSQGSILERDRCNLGLAQSEGSQSYCGKIYSVDLRDECLILFPGSAPSCDSLTLAANKDSCIYSFALNASNIQLCLKIGNDSLRSECNRRLSPACSDEQTDSAKARCLAFLRLDYSQCADDNCLFDFGVAKNSTDACEIISNPSRRQACVSIAASDDTNCLSLEQGALRDVCYGIAGSYLLSASTCEKAFTESIQQQNCIMDVAYKLGDPAICSRSGRQLGADNCFANMSIALANHSLCASVQNSLLRPGCYNKFAITYMEPQVCELLERGMQTDCITSIFNSPLLTSDKCPTLASQEWRDLCYLRSAKLVHDPAICENVVDPNTQSNCIRDSRLT